MTPDRPRRINVIGNQWDTAYKFRGPLVRHLVGLGVEVHYFGPDQDDIYRQRLEALGAVTHGIRMSRSGLNPLQEARTLIALLRALRRIRPDLMFTYFAKPVIYGSIAAWFARVPRRHALIAGLGHAFPMDEGGSTFRTRMLTRVTRLLYRVSLGLNQRVFFQNPEDMQFFIDSGLVSATSAIRVNGTGIDLEYYAASTAITQPVTFVLAARLIEEKGIRDFVAASRILRERGWQSRCILLGGLDDNPSAIMEHEINEWVDDGLIEWPGMVDDVRPWLEASSVYVLPSYYREGVPRSIQEAMAIGRAVITTDTPGCRETVEAGRNGFLVVPRDVPALAVAMERYLEDSELIDQHGRESRRLAEERFDVHRINEVMLGHMGIACHGSA